MSLSVSEVLDGAADLIEADGWWDGNGSPGKRCVVTAIADAADHLTNPHAYGQALRFFQARIDDVVVTWNDAPGRTELEVVEALHKGAAAARWSEQTP